MHSGRAQSRKAVPARAISVRSRYNRPMKIPRISFTVRRMMVAVAVVALAFAIVHLWSLRQLYLKMAAQHGGISALRDRTPEDIAFWEARLTAQHEGLPASDPWPGGHPLVPSMARYHEAMRLKYERAARYPWLPVAPDPPEP